MDSKILRRIIREVMARHIDEMAYRGTLDIVQGDPEDAQRYAGDQMLDFFHGETGRKISHAQSATKALGAGKFKRDATRLLANVPVEVWFAPFVGAPYDKKLIATFSQHQGEQMGQGRASMYDLETAGIDILRTLGYGSVDEINPSEDFVLMGTYSSASIPDRPVSAWTSFHSIFDGGWDSQELWAALEFWLENIANEDLSGIYTFSAGVSADTGDPEMFWECIVQELLTRRGFYWERENQMPEVNDMLTEFKAKLRAVVDKMIPRLKGKLVWVTVT